MIAVLDSYLGGLPLVRELNRRWPHLDIYYLADTAAGTLGNRSAAFIGNRLQSHLDRLAGREPELIVIASHSMGAAALTEIPSPSRVPVLNVVPVTATAAIRTSARGAIGYVSGRAVLESGCYDRLIQAGSSKSRVYGRACPALSALAQEMWVKKPETAMVVKKALHPLRVRQIDTLMAASSDFSGLLSVIARKKGRRVTLIDSFGALAEAATDMLGLPRPFSPTFSAAKVTIAATDVTPHLQRVAQFLLKRNVSLIKTA